MVQLDADIADKTVLSTKVVGQFKLLSSNRQNFGLGDVGVDEVLRGQSRAAILRRHHQ